MKLRNLTIKKIKNHMCLSEFLKKNQRDSNEENSYFTEIKVMKTTYEWKKMKQNKRTNGYELSIYKKRNRR